MYKVSLILSTAALSLQKAGARAATSDLVLWTSQPVAIPQPTVVAVLALIGIGIFFGPAAPYTHGTKPKNTGKIVRDNRRQRLIGQC